MCKILVLVVCPGFRSSPIQLSSWCRCIHFQSEETKFATKLNIKVEFKLNKTWKPCPSIPSCHFSSSLSAHPPTSSRPSCILPCPFPMIWLIRFVNYILFIHQLLLHICQVGLQFVVQIDLKLHHHGIILKHHHGLIQKHEERRQANEVSPVLAESFRFLWPECLLARGFHFSEPAVTIISHLSQRIVIFWSFKFSIWTYFKI